MRLLFESACLRRVHPTLFRKVLFYRELGSIVFVRAFVVTKLSLIRALRNVDLDSVAKFASKTVGSGSAHEGQARSA